MKTHPIIRYGSNDLAIRDDATLDITAGGVQSIAEIDTIRLGTTAALPYATFEPDFWLLNGDFKIVPPANTRAGLIGSVLSDSIGDLSDAITLRFSLTQDFSIDQLTIHFDVYNDEYPQTVGVKFEDASHVTLYNHNYAGVNSSSYTITYTVSNFRYLSITYYSTTTPYRYPRISGIDFDDAVILEGGTIKSAKLTEEIDPLSLKLPISSLDFSLNDTSGDILTAFPDLLEKSPIDVYEVFGGETLYMGRFYVDGRKNKSLSEVGFTAISLIGTMEVLEYKGSSFAHDIEDAIDELLLDTSIVYNLDSALVGSYVSGDIPNMKLRDALKHIAFSSYSYVSAIRSNQISFVKHLLITDISSFDVVIDNSQQSIKSVDISPAVTGVVCNLVDGQPEDLTEPEVDVYSESLAAGSYRVATGKPFQYTSISGATLTWPEFGFTDYTQLFEVTVASPGTVTLTGIWQADRKKTYSYNNTPSPTSKILEIDYLFAWIETLPGSADTNYPTFIYDYYNDQNCVQVSRLYETNVKAGDTVVIQSLGDRVLYGRVHKVNIDLAGGFVIDAEIHGTLV